jgi:hypothetical protein
MKPKYYLAIAASLLLLIAAYVIHWPQSSPAFAHKPDPNHPIVLRPHTRATSFNPDKIPYYAYEQEFARLVESYGTSYSQALQQGWIATSGLISDQKLMKMANEAMLLGISWEDTKTIMAYSVRYSSVTNYSYQQIWNSAMTAIRNGGGDIPGLTNK